jgi:poly(A) polymerase
LDGINLLSCIFPCLEPLRNLEQPSPHQWTALEHSLRSVEALETVLSSLGPAQPAQTELNLAPAAAWGGQIMDHITAIESDVRPRLVTLKLATLLHDTGKAKMRSVDDSGRMRFLGHHEEGAQLVTENLVGHRFSNREVRLAATIVRNHMRPLALAREEHVTPRAVYRFFRDTGPAGVETLLLGLADRLATGRTSTEDEGWQRLLKLTGRMLGDYWNRRRTRISPPSLVNGDDLLREFELQPGPIIGELLDLVVEAQVSGEVRNADEALSLVRERLRTERAGLGAG